MRIVLGEQLPLKQGRCDIAIGDNIAEVTTERQEPLLGLRLENVLSRIDEFLSGFPYKPDKSDLGEDFVE